MLHVMTKAITAPSRRGFILGAAAASGGFVLGFTLPVGGKLAAKAQAAPAPLPFNAYVTISPDNVITVLSAHMDMGQGIYHGIATLLAEELNVPVGDVRVVGAAGNAKLYGNLTWGGTIQGTGGSSGTPSSWERYRQAGAIARTMLIEAAADAWKVAVKEIVAANGILTHGATGKRVTYGEMAEAAARLPVPPEVALKAPSAWQQIGKDETVRVAGRDKVNGTFAYTIDVKLPGMLVALVQHPPLFGGKVKAFDASEAKKVRGVVDVVQISRGVAVVADTTWAAMKGREALKVEWDEGAAEHRGSADLLREYHALTDRPGAVAKTVGDAPVILGAMHDVIEATYEFPYLAHAALEPLDAVAAKVGDGIEIWAGHQIPDLYQAIAAQIAGVAFDKVKLHVMPTGGGFGRRAVADAEIVAEAVETAKAIGWRSPVKVLWTREDDMTGGRYRPLYVHRIRAGLTPDGKISAWQHHIVGQSILSGTPFEPMMVKDGVDETSVEGVADMAYLIPHFRAELTSPKVGVPVLWWRSVGHTHTAYAVETMIDELAKAAGQDPVAFRLAHLPPKSREFGVLTLAADRAGWGTPLPEGRFRGVAVHQSFGSFVAMVAEISMKDKGAFKVERVTAAVDCGVPINPDVIRAQIEGGIGFGLGAAMHSELTLTGGKVDQTNFDSYLVLRLDDMPKVEVHVVPSTMAPTGIGEPGVPPIGPAVANALAAATGRRVRSLPFSKGMAA